MADNINTACWLTINYEVVPTSNYSEQRTRLEDMYLKCQEYYNSHGILSPSKDLIGKLIPKLFNTHASTVRLNGERYTTYDNLMPRSTSVVDNNNIVVPGHCVYKILPSNESEIICKREYIINSEQLTCSVLFGDETTTINVRGERIPLKVCLQLTQSNVNGLVFLLENLKLCKGMEADEVNKRNGTEKWSTILDKTVQIRSRSKSCYNILPFNTNIDHCNLCAKNSKYSMKRKSTEKENETIPIAKPVVPGSSVCILKDRTNELVNEKQDEIVTEAIDDIIKNGAPEKFKTLLKSQVQNSKPGMDKRQRRWDSDMISLCLSLYVRSPGALEELRSSSMLVLPSVKLLQLYKNCIKQTSGINSDNLMWMKKEADRQNISIFGKRGGLLLDEMSIQDELQIVRKGDAWTVVGAVDMGQTNNVISIVTGGTKKVELATHCLQFIFHGFCGFRWPVAYYGSNPATAHQIYVNFWDCVNVLDENGFTVDCVMFDGATTNRSFTNMILKDDPRTQNFTATNIFDSSHKIYVIQDVKHVIKKLRNNIEASKQQNKASNGRYLVLNRRAIIWEHFEDAFNFNMQNGLRIHRKLTKEHIEITSASKMRNGLAEEVLNKDMLFLMKSYQATFDHPECLSSTIELLERTSILVSIFSDNRPISEISDSRIKQLHEIVSFFNTWETNIKESNLFIESKHLFPHETRDDLNSTIVGFISMCQSLLGKGDSINPNYINSDLVENHFCQQRGICNGLNTNPTLAQYGPSNTSICLGQNSVSAKSNGNTKAKYFKATTPCPLNKRKLKKVKSPLRRV